MAMHSAACARSELRPGTLGGPECTCSSMGPFCINTEGGDPHAGEVNLRTYVLFGLPLQLALCDACGAWFDKFYKTSSERSRRGK